MTVSRNRLANTQNGYQGSRKRVLCVCSAGMLRSPTAAWILSNEPFGYNTRAVGASQEYALIPMDEAHVLWAEEIIVMNDEQKLLAQQLLQNVNPDHWRLTPIHVLDIPDNYEFRDPQLVKIMTKIFMKMYKEEAAE